MDSSNYRHRVLHKLARELGLPKLTFQVIRRTIATLGKTKGHPKDIQGLMRHSRLATTMDVYMQSLEREVRSAINSIHDELVATGTEGPAPQQPTTSGKAHDHTTGENTPIRDGSFKKQPKNTTEGGAKKTVVPSRGKILLFAGKMRASNLEDVR